MSLNPNSWYFIRLTKKLPPPNILINGKEINCVATFNFLGITLDKNLTWGAHVDCMAMKLSKITGIICKLKQFLDSRIILLLYKSLVLSHFNYGILLWGYNITRLQNLQKKIVRIISHIKFICHSEPIFKKLDILKLDDIFELKKLKFCHSIINDTCPVFFKDMLPSRHSTVRCYNTRNIRSFNTVRVKHKFAEKCIRYEIPFLLNHKPDLIISKLYTHSLNGLAFYFKKRCLNNYCNTCSIPNCYVCALNA